MPWVHENNSFTYIRILHVVLRIIKTHYNVYSLPSASINLLQYNLLMICFQLEVPENAMVKNVAHRSI